MKPPTENPEPYLAAAAELLDAEGMSDAAELLRTSTPRFEATGYDNWNGGTNIWTIYLLIEPALFAQLGGKRERLQEQINNRLKPIFEQVSSDWYHTSIAPKIEERPEWRNSKSGISRATRQQIIDVLRLENVRWSGRLSESDFLSRLYDLEALPSNDHRFKDAARDIWQHRVNNPLDWPDDWIFDDGRFMLLKGGAEVFLRFLSEMIHPTVRPDRDECLKLLKIFNDHLQSDGWQIVEEEVIAGRPRFMPKKVQPGGTRSVSRARAVAEALDARWMQTEIERLERAVERDPALAIGTAKELVESCCKTILVKKNAEFPRNADLPTLTKLLARELNLVPKGITESAKGAETIRLLLRNLAALTQYLAELRGLYGSGHGRDGKHRGLEPRHGLAVGAAVVFIDFVTDTYNRRFSGG